VTQYGTPQNPERRLVARHTDALSTVKVIAPGRAPAIYAIHNISQGGVCLRSAGNKNTSGGSLWRGMRVQLRFIIPLSNGTTKIHLRHATVVWVKAGMTGFAIDTIPRAV
jgi:hypothetical protein